MQMDVKCVSPGSDVSYYPEHLPVLGIHVHVHVRMYYVYMYMYVYMENMCIAH